MTNDNTVSKEIQTEMPRPVNGSLKTILYFYACYALCCLMLLAVACQPLTLLDSPAEDGPKVTVESTASTISTLTGDPVNGAYIFAIANGCGCHYNGDLGGLAGGNEFSGPWGTAFSRNLTPDETGILSYSDQQIAMSIRFGVRVRDGVAEELAPVMPRLSTLADQDVVDLIAYLRSRPPIHNDIPPHQLTNPTVPKIPEQATRKTAPTDPVERGAYLTAITRCGRCHTPTNEDGRKDLSRLLAGAPVNNTVAPNLTPHELTGLGAWSEQMIMDFIRSGVYSDGIEADSAMKGVVDNGLDQLTEGDARAIGAYLKSLPAIENLP